MNRIIFLVLILLSGFKANCQTFAAAFDPWDNTLAGGNGYSWWTNVGLDNVSEAVQQQSYLNMFKATKDIHYLEKFAIQATRLMERRDDYIADQNINNKGVYGYYINQKSLSPNVFGIPYLPNGCPSLATVTSVYAMTANENTFLYGGRSMTWSCDEYSDDPDLGNCTYFYQPTQFFEVCEQMAAFCYYLHSDPDFAGIVNENVPLEVQNIMHEPYNPTYSDWISGTNGNPVTTYADFADWLYFHICQVYSYINNECWDNNNESIYNPTVGEFWYENGYYTYPAFSTDHGGFAQINMQCMAGRTLIYLYFYETGILGLDDLNPSSNGDLQGNHDFLGRIQEIGHLVKDQLQYNHGDPSYSTSPSAYAWVNDATTYYSGCKVEDFVHGSSLMQFADLCYRFKITCLGEPWCQIISKQDMQYLANDFARDMAISPLVTLPGNDNSNNSRWAQGVCNEGDIYNDAQYNQGGAYYTPVSGSYAFLTMYNPYIYAEILNDYVYSALYNPAPYPSQYPGVTSNVPYTTLALYENAKIYDENNTNGYSTYKNIFNPVAVYPDVNCSLIDAPVTYSYTPIQWSAATSGNYDGSATCLEFVSSKNNTETFYMNRIQTTDHSIRTTYNQVSGTANLTDPINGLCSGNFSGSGTDYVAATDGHYIDILADNSGVFNSVLSSAFNASSFLGGSDIIISSGNYLNSNNEQILTIGSNGQGLIYDYNNSNPMTSYIQFPFNMVGITTGYFDGASGGIEVAAYDPNGNIYIYKILPNNPSSGYFSFTAQHALNIGSLPINGISSGNFDGSGQYQIVLHNNYDGTFRIYKVNSAGQITQVGLQAFPDGTEMPDGSGPNYFTTSQMWQMGIMACVKNFPGSPGDALATFRNCDGRIIVFDMQGQCEGQNVSDIYFSDGVSPPTSPPAPCNTIVQNTNNPYSTFTNAYTIDYNAQNTLTASNDIVSPGASVQFTAGNEIDIKGTFTATPSSISYFDAKIDPTLSCSPDRFFHKPIKHKPPVKYSAIPFTDFKTFQFDSLGLGVKNSPTTGQFSVNLLSIDSTDIGKEADIYICDMLGRKIYQGNVIIEKNIDYPLNLSTRANGDYMVIIKTKNKLFHKKVVIQH